MSSKSWKENNLLSKFELTGEDTTSSLLLEKIYGNVAIVYHRGDKDKLNHLLKGTYKNKSHIDFNYYNKALYTTFDLESQLNSNSHQRNDMRRTYGRYIIKLAVKGISNFWFCDYDTYKKFYPNAIPETWKEEQFKRFNINKELRKTFGGDSLRFNHVTISKFFEKYNALGTRVKGIVYYGQHDGNCALIYDWKTAVPIAISNDEGKTWKKISEEETKGLRQNFNKNDYIDTNKKITEPFFEIDEYGNVTITDKEITSLEGVPETVEGNFTCIDCKKLPSLEGAPRTVKGRFDCRGCENLKSLVGAPKTVKGDFYCSDCENLTSLAGAPKEVGGSFICSFCKNLKSLGGVPQTVKGSFLCNNCENLESLDGAPDTVEGRFDCGHCKNLKSLAEAPVTVKENFSCSSCENLKSLVGAPKTVKGDFYCSDCKNLKSLGGAPRIVRGDFGCSGCENLKSLVGAPKTVKGDFYCKECKELESLEGAPRTVRHFKCNVCEKLTSLEGAPRTVNGDFDCRGCKSLESLDGAPDAVERNFYCNNCENLNSLAGAPNTVEGDFCCYGCNKLASLNGFNTKIGGGLIANYELLQLYDQKYKESKYLDFFKYYELREIEK